MRNISLQFSLPLPSPPAYTFSPSSIPPPLISICFLKSNIYWLDEEIGKRREIVTKKLKPLFSTSIANQSKIVWLLYSVNIICIFYFNQVWSRKLFRRKKYNFCLYHRVTKLFQVDQQQTQKRMAKNLKFIFVLCTFI